MTPDEIAKMSATSEDFPPPCDRGEAEAAQGGLSRVFVGDEFISVVYGRDDDEGARLPYQFQMAILDYDLRKE